MHKFDFAHRLALLAAEADEINKITLTPHELRQLELCRDAMHATAQELAGDRVGEIYDDEELSAEDLLEIRRTALIALVSGTQAEGLLPTEPKEVYSPHTHVIEHREAA